MSCSCGQSHDSQRVAYPIGSEVKLISPIQSSGGRQIAVGESGIVVGHCNDGRASVKFDDESHTFHFPDAVFVSINGGDATGQIIAVNRLDMPKEYRSISVEKIAIHIFRGLSARADTAQLVYFCDDADCVILKNRNGQTTGYVSEDVLLSEARKVYDAPAPVDAVAVLRRVDAYFDSMPVEQRAAIAELCGFVKKAVA